MQRIASINSISNKQSSIMLENIKYWDQMGIFAFGHISVLRKFTYSTVYAFRMRGKVLGRLS